MLYLTNTASESDVSRFSMKVAIAGLVAMSLMSSAACFLGLTLLAHQDGTGFHFLVSRLLLVACMSAPLIWVGIIIATCLLRSGPVFPRFLMASIGGCIGWGSFLVALAMASPSDFAERVHAVAPPAAVYSISFALSVLGLQMWVRWSLQEFRPDPPTRWRLGTRDLLGVTFVFAVGCALFLSSKARETILTQFFLIGFGVVTGGLTAWVLLAFVSRARRGIPVMFAFAFFVIAPMLGFAIYLISGVSPAEVTQYLGVLYCFAAIVSILMVGSGWMAAAWLRACGWRCVEGHRSG